MNDSFAQYLETLSGLLTVNQVCDLLGIHHDTLYRWVRSQEVPVLKFGAASKPLLRFAPKDLAAWVRATLFYFRGPSRSITDWMEEQILRRGGPREMLPLLSKVLTLTGYDWLAAARRVRADSSLSFSTFHLFEDFMEAVNQLSIAEQRQLLSDIKSGKFDQSVFPVEDAE